MKKISIRIYAVKLMLLALLALPTMSGMAVQYFQDSDSGDVDVEFRKTGGNQEQVETVGYVGYIGDFLNMAPGAVTNLNNFQKGLTNMCPDGFGNLQWGAFCSFNLDHLTIGTWNFTNGTCWYTQARTNVNNQSKAPQRPVGENMTEMSFNVFGVSDGANQISSSLSVTNTTNNSVLVEESYSTWSGSSTPLMDNYFLDAGGKADFGGLVINYSVETTNVTAGGTSYADLYQVVGASTSGSPGYVDPITGTTNGAAYFVGYFTLNPNGSMTFTRAAPNSVPNPGTVTSTVTNGFSPLSVIFTNSATGSITNWVWNFGDGTIITNTTGANVSHTYSTTGTYTVTLTVRGPGGASTVTNTAFIVTSPQPKIKFTVIGKKFIISGTNCPINVQYRILGATNLPGTWITQVTSTFQNDTTFWYTNMTTNAASYFKMVSP